MYPSKKVKKTVNDWELINDAKALWTRNPSDITDEEYKSFYQSLTKDFGEPLMHTHFSAEGEVEFKSILYIPKEAPYDLYQDYYKKQNNLKLYVRRVMITDEFDELLPRFRRKEEAPAAAEPEADAVPSAAMSTVNAKLLADIEAAKAGIRVEAVQA